MIVIALNNAKYFSVRLRKPNATTGAFEPATGLTTVTMKITADPASDTEITGLAFTLTEIGTTLGLYAISVAGATLTTPLTAYVDKKVYVKFYTGTDLEIVLDAIVRSERAA